MSRMLATLGVVLCLPSIGSSQSEGPPPLYSFALAFDENRQRLVLFGGYMRGSYSGDTWEWDGQQWKLASQSGPQGRNAPRMVFDAGRNTVVMFGGDIRSGALGDSWEWDGRTWTEITGPGPAPRTLHGMAFDAHRQRVVLFGGRNGPDYLPDTWELDRSGWKKMSDSGPPPRMMHGMAYDPERRLTLVVGGNKAVAQPEASDVLGDAWTWNGMRWDLLAGGPGARDHTSATFNPVDNGILVVGGARVASGPLDDAVLWRGDARWTPMPPTGIGARAGHLMATDSRNRRVFLYGGFGGNASQSELWEYSSAGWKRVWRKEP